MTRIKTVYPTDMVCHLWANRNAHDVRNATSNIYTRGAALFSYGSHHVIGAFMDSPAKGAAPVLLWNDDTYGQTTGRHHSDAWRALTQAQRMAAVHVPGMRDSDINPHGLARLALACIKATVTPLEKTKKARENRAHYLARAQKYFDSARTIYGYIGDKKAAATVPTLNGADTSKEDVLTVLQNINRAEYLAQAAEYFKRADNYMGTAVYNVQCGNDCTACRAGVDADNMANRAIEHYKKAGARVPANVKALQAKAAAFVVTHTPAARVETINALRERLSDSYRRAVFTLASFRRGGYKRKLSSGNVVQTGHTRTGFSWALERMEYPSESEYMELWPVESVRTARVSEWKALQGRVTRMLAAHALESSIESLQGTITDYTNNLPKGINSSVPNAHYVRANLRKVAALFAPAVPEHFCEAANRAANHADTVAAAHNERMQALNAARISAWRAGERVTVPRDLPPMVRIVGDTLETSWGAVVPVEHAARLVRIAQRVARAGGMTYTQGTGPKVGHFTVNHIGADMSAVIGCHSFTASEAGHALELLAGYSIPAESTNS